MYDLQVIIEALFLTAAAICLLGGIAFYSKAEMLSSKFFIYLMMGHFVLNLLGFFIFGFDNAIFSFVGMIMASVYLIIDL